MLMVSMFYGLDENQGQVGAQHGTDWSVVTNTNTNTLPPSSLLSPSSITRGQSWPGPNLDLSHSQESQSSATSGG